jgi:cysteine-rich repeat protein
VRGRCAALLMALSLTVPLHAAGQVCFAPPVDPTGFWPADGSGSDIVGGHTADLLFGARYSAGSAGQAFVLDGVDDYVSVPDDAALNAGTGDFTVDLWVNFDTLDGEQILVEKFASGTEQPGWTFTKWGYQSFQFTMLGGYVATPDLPITAGNWYHFAARRGGNTLTVFLNGDPVASAFNSGGNVDTPATLKFGHRGNSVDTPGSNDDRGFYLRGRIDEVHLFVARALTDEEIRAIYDAGAAGVCSSTVCGDGRSRFPEECDDGNLVGGDGCEADCTKTCGNGALGAGEACDDGNTVDGDGCDTNCTLTACGNGIPTTGETCDDGNLTSGDGCDSNCTLTACGNGVASSASGETCDDGNLVDDDGCDSNCTPTGCGNGIQTASEACDDGNPVDGDGCDSNCAPTGCGNGVVNAGEVCDDGNLFDDDGCDSNCIPSGCGNGTVSSALGETCDDGNHVSGDGCDSNCTTTACGNGVLTASTGESCDDGNLTDGDGCEADCSYTPVNVVVPPGGTATTDPSGDGATPQKPTQIAITTTTGGTITMDPVNDTVAVNGVQIIGISVQIEAPAATPEAPLVIKLTIDASIIPIGESPFRLSVVRNRVELLDCNGPLVADPDPCLAEVSDTPEGDVQLTVLTSHASLWQVAIRGQSKLEQACVNAMNAAGRKVAGTQSKAAITCLKLAATGAQPNAQACLTADATGAIGKAFAKTSLTETKKCSVAVPPFGFTGSPITNAAAQAAALGVVADVFGADLTTAVVPATSQPAATCQATVLRAAQKLFDLKANLLVACEKARLMGKTSLAVTASQLAECLAEVDADPKGKIAASVAKLASTVQTKCATLNVAATLPGTCFATGSPSACMDARTDCRICRMYDAANDLGADCDAFDDGLSNGSCP